MFKKLIQRLAQSEINAAFYKGTQKATEEQRETRDRLNDVLIQDAIGKKVIYVSNEWEDPLFCVITGVSDLNKKVSTPLLTATCVLTGKPKLVFLSSYYLADEKMVDAILKLDPFERWNLSAGKVHTCNMWEKSYPPNHDLTDPVKLKQQLKQVGFI